MDKTIRRVTDLAAQQDETYQYWRIRSFMEKMDAVTELVRDAYLSKGIDLEDRKPDRKIIRVLRPDWKAVK